MLKDIASFGRTFKTFSWHASDEKRNPSPSNKSRRVYEGKESCLDLSSSGRAAGQEGTEALSKKLVERITEAMEGLAGNPRPRGSLKLKGEDNLYRIRVGDYRIVYEIHDDQVLILVIRIRHRKNRY
jgi:mRNA interferase RelE/StbE